MRIYGLVGKKLDHSFSKDFFSKKFKKEHIINTKYVNIQLDNLLNIHKVIKDLNISDSEKTDGGFCEDYYFIVTDKCTECKGFHDEPQCAAVCPVDCCVPDEDNV